MPAASQLRSCDAGWQKHGDSSSEPQQRRSRRSSEPPPQQQQHTQQRYDTATLQLRCCVSVSTPAAAR
jgi:hypothetical protein